MVVATLTKPPESLGVMHIVCDDNYGTTSTRGARQRGQLLPPMGGGGARPGGFGTEPAEPRVLSTLELDQAALNVFTGAAGGTRPPNSGRLRSATQRRASRVTFPPSCRRSPDLKLAYDLDD